MEKQNIWNKIISKIIVALTMIWIYLPLIGGIITPMFYLIPLMYYSWYLFGNPSTSTIWFAGWITLERPWEITIVVFESLLFVLGCYLLIAGIIHLAKARRKKINIASTGPYKYIRHPQHLGIILISIPFAFILWTIDSDIGIRIADILSFMLNTVILLIISEIEEINMKQKFPQEYPVYSKQAGFLFPKIRKKAGDIVEALPTKTKKQLLFDYSKIIVLYLVGYIVFVVIIYLLIKYTPLIPLIFIR